MTEPTRLKDFYDALGNLSSTDQSYYYDKKSGELIDNIRATAKCLAFDVEASRRENKYMEATFNDLPYYLPPPKRIRRTRADRLNLDDICPDLPENLKWLTEVYGILYSVNGKTPKSLLSFGIVKNTDDLINTLITYAKYLHFDLEVTKSENETLKKLLEEKN